LIFRCTIVLKSFAKTAAPVAALLLLAMSCQETGKDGKLLDTPTSGSIRVAVDETFQPIVESHIDTFQKLYPDARVRASYLPETEAIAQFMASDSVRDVILSRRLTSEEEAEMARMSLVPVTTPIALDGIAVILHPSNPDSLLTVAQLAELCSGRFTRWQQINSESKQGDVAVVFDNAQSSTARYVRDSVLHGAALTKAVFATKTHPELIEYVATHPGAMGILGVNWLSDGDDPAVKGFLRKVRVVGLSSKNSSPTNADYMQPFQAYVALSKVKGRAHYPLSREIFIISREGRSGLGTGFASFVAGDKGQRIFLKAGLVPASVPVRLVQTADDRPAEE
jgi:phosphate transport system substrate-binding protein